MDMRDIILAENEFIWNENKTPEEQGWIGALVEPVNVMYRLEMDNLYRGSLFGGDLGEESTNVPGQENPHFTIIYGLTEKGLDMDWGDMFINYVPSTVTVESIEWFDNPKYWILVAKLKMTKELEKMREAYMQFDHYEQEFPEYKPHVTMAYFDLDTDENLRQDIKSLFNDLIGKELKVVGYEVDDPFGDKSDKQIINSHRRRDAKIQAILNAWDESKHPRDKKGRFTFVIGTAQLFRTSPVGGVSISDEAVSKLQKQVQDYANKSKANAKSVEYERDENDYYQNSGYKWINDDLRSGGTLKDCGAENLDNSCRFSSDKQFKVYRGESSFSNNWSGVKKGDKLPDGLTKSFISTSTDQNIADRFATHDRMNTGAKIYETTIEFTVPPTQRFGIPNVYNKGAIARGESEILLPYNTRGTVTGFKETTKKVGKDTIIQQVVTVDLSTK